MTSTGGTKPWLFITSSSDGTKLAATLTGNMWTSTDSGATWTEVTSTGSHKAWKAILRVWHLMCLDVGGDPAVRQSLVSNDARSSTSFVPTGRAIPVLSVPTRPSRVVLCRQRAGVASNIRGKNKSSAAKNLPRASHFHNPSCRRHTFNPRERDGPVP